jgi:amidase
MTAIPSLPTKTTDDPCDWDATVLSSAIHARQISCREAMLACLTRVDALNPAFNAIVSRVAHDPLLAQADTCDRELANGASRGWMHGFPLAVKDLSAVAGIALTKGSPLLRNNIPTHDDLMVQRLKSAGAIVIGKTNTPEFGLGSHTYNTVFGTTRNAYDPTCCAGGSSGGAAVALALRMVPVADGSDMMGSLRNPAAFNNLFGLRPSMGRVPDGPASDSWVAQLGTTGPMARTVEDLARLLAVQAGRDDRVPLSIAGQWPGAPLDLTLDLRSTRIGWLGDLGGYLPVENGILPLCERALARLAADGCQVEPIAPAFDPHMAWQTWLTWRRWLVTASLGPYWDDPLQRAQLKPEAAWEVEQGQQLSARAVSQASADRSRLYQQLLSMFAHHDFLALPSAQVWPFDADVPWPRQVAGRTMDTYHRWMEVVIYATLAGLPVVSVPVGFDSRGLPMGMQLIGRPQADLSVLRMAQAHAERSVDILARRPDVLAPVAG